MSRWGAGETLACGSSTCAEGVEGGSDVSELGVEKRDWRDGDVAIAVKPDARRVEFPEADEVVESSGNSTTFHVCRVASGANETLRFAKNGSASLHRQ